jgi:glyoxylase-like metal-dependent hydrolase (beta-lactamase superfamily II)
MPCLTGKSDYPPQYSTMGGAIAQLARLFPRSGYDFGDRVRPLPDDGSVPGLEYWRWVHTPGHTPGHVSLFREMDGTLLAGDALATINMDSWISQLPRKRELHRPPAPFTPDWEASRESVVCLAGLEPSVIAAGHGLPMTGRNVAEELQSYTGRFSPPRTGRYVGSPAAADEEGVKELPPPVPDPLPKALAGAAVAVATGAATLALVRPRRR